MAAAVCDPPALPENAAALQHCLVTRSGAPAQVEQLNTVVFFSFGLFLPLSLACTR